MEFLKDTNQLFALVLILTAVMELLVAIPILKREFNKASNKTAAQEKTQATIIMLLRMFACIMVLAAVGIYMLRPFVVN